MRRRVLLILIAALAVPLLAIATARLHAGDEQARGADAAAVTRPAAEPPSVVVVLTFDEFPIDAARLPDGQIDRARFPNLAALVSTATWFPNAQAVHDETSEALPALLDARLPRPGGRADRRHHPKNLLTLFGERGWRIVAREEASDLCPPRFCPRGNVRRRPTLANLKAGRKERFERWIAQIQRRPERTLYYKHVLLPHLPWIYLPSGRETRVTLERLANVAGFADPWLTLHNEQRQLLQIGFVDRELGKLIDRLRRLGLFDRALIAIAADHGISFDLGVADRRRVTPRNIDEVAPVPFIFKAPGQRAGLVVRGLVQTIDFTPTIAYLAGLSLDWQADGVPAFERAKRRLRFVEMPTRDFRGRVRITVDEWLRRRHANIARRARTFGSGPASALLLGSPWSRLYRFGDRARVIGTEAHSLATQGTARVRAVLFEPQLYSRVDKRRVLVPVQVAGRIVGGRANERRDLAVAVNGRVVAVGRSFRMRNGRRRLYGGSELFSLIVPESALRDGFNRVIVYEVARSSPPRLLAIGSN